MDTIIEHQEHYLALIICYMLFAMSIVVVIIKSNNQKNGNYPPRTNEGSKT